MHYPKRRILWNNIRFTDCAAATNNYITALHIKTLQFFVFLFSHIPRFDIHRFSDSMFLLINHTISFVLMHKTFIFQTAPKRTDEHFFHIALQRKRRKAITIPEHLHKSGFYQLIQFRQQMALGI